MKKVTTANKLAEILGLTGKVDTSHYEEDPKKRKKLQKTKPGIQGITEDEIQKFREAQGVIYFLQAPELFTNNICKHCNEPFLVSRKQVAYCSYTCIEKSLEEIGITWSRKGNYEALAQDPSVFEKNEPIWITKLDQIRKVLDYYEQLNAGERNQPAGGEPAGGEPAGND